MYKHKLIRKLYPLLSGNPYHLLAPHPVLYAAQIIAYDHARLPHADVAAQHQIVEGHGAHKVQQLVEYLLRIAVVQAKVLELGVEMLQLANQLLPRGPSAAMFGEEAAAVPIEAVRLRMP